MLFEFTFFQNQSLQWGFFTSAPSHRATEGHTCLHCAVVRRVRYQAGLLFHLWRDFTGGEIRDIPKCPVSILQEGKNPIPAAIESAVPPETQHRLHQIVLRKAQEERRSKKAQCTVPAACVPAVCVCVCVCVMAFLAVVLLIELEGASSVSFILPHPNFCL